MSPPAASEIEVGASLAEGNLRYWRAKEAVRQGELRLSAQAMIKVALETRATALTGWAAAGLLALAAAGATATGFPRLIGAGVAGSLLFGAAAACIHVARPRQDWSITGYGPHVILEDKLGTELELLESLAQGIGPGIQRNNVRLDQTAIALRWAGWLLIAAPIAGLLSYAATRAVT